VKVCLMWHERVKVLDLNNQVLCMYVWDLTRPRYSRDTEHGESLSCQGKLEYFHFSQKFLDSSLGQG